jgi:hypothetical protein
VVAAARSRSTPSASAVRRAGAASGVRRGAGAPDLAGCGGSTGIVGTAEPGGAVLLFGGCVTADLPQGHPVAASIAARTDIPHGPSLDLDRIAAW